jgi:sulfate adenylyltransferase subunit 1
MNAAHNTALSVDSASAPLLRVITAGSVDDGKSTLIGRLLFDSKSILVDQLDAIKSSRFQRTTDGSVDLSLLTDGLEAEREQGITIDVAYRYFNTAKRKFIFADAPGHEQYTRNMVTGTSTADAVIVLIDATRVQEGQLLPQTKRHSAIAKLLGVQHIIVAVNKMDLVDFSETRFNTIATAYRALAATLQLPTPTIVPLSALSGDNVTLPSPRMPWYRGEPLLPLLEALPSRAPSQAQALRFPVQWVIRADGSAAEDFRGYAGRVASGHVTVGDAIAVATNGAQAHVTKILLGERALQSASAGQSVTLVLDVDVDISRGDTIVSPSELLVPAAQIEADLCWLDTQALNLNRKYWLKHGTRTTYAKIDRIDSVLDVQTLSHATDSPSFGLNTIGRVRITAQHPLIADAFETNRATGAFVLIDPATHQTAAAGMIRATRP